MEETLKKIGNVLVLLLIIYPFGILLGIIFELLRHRKIIRILHWERFPHLKEKIILAASHPSMADPFLLGGLLFRRYLINPLKYSPLFGADKANFYDSWA